MNRGGVASVTRGLPGRLEYAAMAGRAPEFDADVECFGAYTRRLNQYFVAQDIGSDQEAKKRAVLLCAIGAKTFGLLEDLIAPATVSQLGKLRGECQKMDWSINGLLMTIYGHKCSPRY